MKRNLLIFTLALMLVGGLSIAAEAQRRWHPRHNINRRDVRQQNRIYNGVRNGSLNRREARRLERQHYRINRTEARMRRSGGHLSLRERYRLRRMQNRASRNIYRQKHDRQHYRRYRRP